MQSSLVKILNKRKEDSISCATLINAQLAKKTMIFVYFFLFFFIFGVDSCAFVAYIRIRETREDTT